MKRRTPLIAYRLRRCLSMHSCCICPRTITLGEFYYDGGYGRRAHKLCAENDRIEGEQGRPPEKP